MISTTISSEEQDFLQVVNLHRVFKEERTVVIPGIYMWESNLTRECIIPTLGIIANNNKDVLIIIKIKEDEIGITKHKNITLIPENLCTKNYLTTFFKTSKDSFFYTWLNNQRNEFTENKGRKIKQEYQSKKIELLRELENLKNNFFNLTSKLVETETLLENFNNLSQDLKFKDIEESIAFMYFNEEVLKVTFNPFITEGNEFWYLLPQLELTISTKEISITKSKTLFNEIYSIFCTQYAANMEFDDFQTQKLLKNTLAHPHNYAVATNSGNFCFGVIEETSIRKMIADDQIYLAIQTIRRKLNFVNEKDSNGSHGLSNFVYGNKQTITHFFTLITNEVTSTIKNDTI